MQWPSDLPDEIVKAHQYQNELWRIKSYESGWIFAGNHHTHTIEIRDGRLQCDCYTWSQKARGAECCQHIRVLESLGVGSHGEMIDARRLGRAVLATLHAA